MCNIMGYNNNMKKKMKADDYFNNGIIESARFGNVIMTSNIMGKAESSQLFLEFASKGDELKERIDAEIKEIREIVSICNPKQLLLFAESMFMTSQLGISSEFQITGERIAPARFCEYMQSVLVSTDSNYVESDEDQTAMFNELMVRFEKLYGLLHSFLLSWVASKQEDILEDGLTIDELLEALLFYNVRGNRYQVFNSLYYDYLLQPHNDEFIKEYGITADEVVEGFKKLEYSIVQGKIDSIFELADVFDTDIKGETDAETFAEVHQAKLQNIIDEAFGFKNNDVKYVTGWPDNFIRGLSYELGEDNNFFKADKEYSGWPIIDLPVHKKPFITIEGKKYCFDYYSLTDNLYRAIQRLISSNNPNYNWKDRQAEGSETMVEKLFSKLLPDCLVYRNNYYPISGSMKKLAENDILIVYHDTLLIIEVKAGAFVYTSPLTDYPAHVKSYRTLIEKADHQCDRTFEYINSNSTAEFYNQDKTKKFAVNKGDYNYIYQISVTVDNINEVAARAEKMGFFKLKSDAISISVDDLIVYSEYFESPLVFMHYLMQRKAATTVPTLALYDELDHLGMYIKDNCYTYKMEDLDPDSKYFYAGYREDLDKYFGALYAKGPSVKKPVQDMQPLFMKMISVIEKGSEENKVWLSSYLLNLSYDGRKNFEENINAVYNRQSIEKREFPVIFGGDGKSVKMTCFVKQEGIASMGMNEKQDYIFATMIWNNEERRACIELAYDKNGQLLNVSGREFSIDEIDEGDFDRLKLLGAENAARRVELHKKRNRKIGRNEKCPCGSGKKYKHCCGR